MKAVSDTSSLGYLILIAQSELLPKSFSSISIPEQVRDELLDKRAPEAIRRWMSATPGWLSVAGIRGLHLSGTLGILADAGRRKLVNLPQVVADLQKTSFRARPDLLRKLLEQEP